MSTARPKITNTEVVVAATVENEETAWLKFLCTIQTKPSDPILPPFSCLIANPTNPYMSSAALKTQVTEFLNKTDKLILSSLPDTYYQECFEPIIPRYKLKLLALRDISANTMEDLMTHLDFSDIKKIGIKDLNNEALWALYSKLTTHRLNNNTAITIICGDGIAENWKQAFAALKQPSTDFTNLFQIVMLLGIPAKANNKRNRLEAASDKSSSTKRVKTVAEAELQKAKDELEQAKQIFASEILASNLRVLKEKASLTARIADLELQLRPPTPSIYSSQYAPIPSFNPPINNVNVSTSHGFPPYNPNQAGTWSTQPQISPHVAGSIFSNINPNPMGSNFYTPASSIFDPSLSYRG